jgi:hypothetical protein
MEEYEVYHRNTATRSVIRLPVTAVTPRAAIAQTVDWAKRWNWEEGRANMVVKYIECEGIKVTL